jgi:hypothetical protein
MNWLATLADFNVKCVSVDLLNRKDPLYREARILQKRNLRKMEDIAARKKWQLGFVRSDLYSNRVIAHTPLLRKLRSTLKSFAGDYMVDISSLPRSVALPALRVLWESDRVQNLLVAFTEEPGVGALEHQAKKFGAPAFLPLFAPAKYARFSVWFPILGWNKHPIAEIRKRYEFNDIYPVVGFPSSRPIETDKIVRLNMSEIFDRTEKIIFASMNDPFQLSIRLNGAIDEIRSALKNDVMIAISPHGSKPQSVGVFLSAMIRGASIVYCQPLSYQPREGEIGLSHVYWLKGTPYGKSTGPMA